MVLAVMAEVLESRVTLKAVIKRRNISVAKLIASKNLQRTMLGIIVSSPQ